MKLELHYFGWIAEKTGCPGEAIVLEKSTVAELRDELEKEHPQLKGMSYRIACDRELVHNEAEATLNENAEIALLPAFAGG